jgi:hypothetical protein
MTDTNPTPADQPASESTPAAPAGDVIAEIAARAADTVQADPPPPAADPAADVVRPPVRGAGGKFLPKADGTGVKRSPGRPRGSKTRKAADVVDAAQGGFFTTGTAPPRPKLDLGEPAGAVVDVIPAGPHPKALAYGEAYATILKAGVEYVAEEEVPYKPGQRERLAEAVALMIPPETAENLPPGANVLAETIGYAGPAMSRPKAQAKVKTAVGIVVDGVAKLWGKATGRGRGT